MAATEPVPLIINGEDVTTSTTFSVISPSSSKSIWSSSAADVPTASRAVSAASDAFPAWSATKPAVRAGILHRAADVLERRADELGDAVVQETGSPDWFAKGFEVGLTAGGLRDCAGRIAGALAGQIPVVDREGQAAVVLKQPFGVVLGIAPWNAPIVLGVRAALYPLAAGNTVVLKGSELCPRTFWILADIFREAGLPAGCLNMIVHRPEDAAAVTTSLIEHPAVRKINFTGSTITGAIIAATAGKNLKPVLLELGGKASAVVLDDADVELAARECAKGAFLHAGQICMSTERILVQPSILPAFRTALRSALRESHSSPDADPWLVSAGGASKTRRLVSDAVSRGATLIHGSNADIDVAEATASMQPVVLEGVTKDMDLFYTESFGPQVFLVEVKDDDEAVAVANDTEYGLSGSVFTKDLARGFRVAKRIESGAIHINSMSVHDEPNLPHGGWKKSGYGRFSSNWGLDEFLQTKAITYME